MNPSPLRYPGGKYKLYRYISELVRKNNCSTYIEPFCGGAAIALELLFSKTVNQIVINDYDYTIFCFWDSLLNRTDEFIYLIETTDVNIIEWHKQKTVRENMNMHDRLEIGFSTFFLNRTNRSGIIDKAGPIGGMSQRGNYLMDCRFNKPRLISQIQQISKHKNQIEVYNLEALDFIENIILKKRKAFTFFDPPYYGKGPELYTNFYTHGDHVNLANEILQQLKRRKWIVTYDNVNPIKAMYPKTSSIEYSLQYTLQEKRISSELMFFSKSIKHPSNEGQYINIL